VNAVNTSDNVNNSVEHIEFTSIFRELTSKELSLLIVKLREVRRKMRHTIYSLKVKSIITKLVRIINER